MIFFIQKKIYKKLQKSKKTNNLKANYFKKKNKK